MGGSLSNNRGLKLVMLGRKRQEDPQGEVNVGTQDGQDHVNNKNESRDFDREDDLQDNCQESGSQYEDCGDGPHYISDDGNENVDANEIIEESFNDPADFVVDGLLKYDFVNLKRRTAVAEEELATLADCIEDDIKKVLQKVMKLEGPRPTDYRTPYDDIRRKYMFFKECGIEIINMPVNRDDPIIHKPINSQDQVTVIQTIALDDED